MSFSRTPFLRKNQHGFTLLELLTVILIVGLLAAVVIGYLNSAKLKSRDSYRVADIRTLQKVLEQYFDDTGTYPQTFIAGNPIEVATLCDDPTDYIPGVVPIYIGVLPSDPRLDCAGTTVGWSYASDGADYKLVTRPEAGLMEVFADPVYDGGTDPCLQDGTTLARYAIYTEGAACWDI